MEGFQLSEDAARRTAAAVRRVEGMGPQTHANAGRQRHVKYKPAFYRLAAGEGDGEYAARAQAWDADAGEMADVADTHHTEYDRDVTVFDYRGRDGAAAGAAGTGLIVHGWKVWVDGDWITLVDVGGGPGEADAASYSFTAHYAGSSETTAAFASYKGALHCFVDIGLDVRQCADNGGLPALHPGYQKTLASGPCKTIATWAGDDVQWIRLPYTATAPDGGNLGYGIEAINGFAIQCRATVEGVMELRVVNDLADGPVFNGCMIEGFVRRVACPSPPGTAAAPIIEFGNGHDHEDLDMEPVPPGVVWGDGIWRPADLE